MQDDNRDDNPRNRPARTSATPTPERPGRRLALALFGLFLGYLHFELLGRLFAPFGERLLEGVENETTALALILAVFANLGLLAVAWWKAPKGVAKWVIVASLTFGLLLSSYFLFGYYRVLFSYPLPPLGEIEEWSVWLEVVYSIVLTWAPPLVLYGTAAFFYGYSLWRLVGRG
jgi:hypothetical protein